MHTVILGMVRSLCSCIGLRTVNEQHACPPMQIALPPCNAQRIMRLMTLPKSYHLGRDLEHCSHLLLRHTAAAQRHRCVYNQC